MGDTLFLKMAAFLWNKKRVSVSDSTVFSPFGDVDTIKSAICYLRDHSAGRVSFVLFGLQFVESRFSRSDMRDSFEALYREPYDGNGNSSGS